MRNAELEEKELTKARNAAYRFLSYRPRSRAEVDRKLREKGFPDSIVQAVLLDLGRLGYINDEQFAGQWARSRINLRGFGKRRIEYELRDKGVDTETIRRELEKIFAQSSEIDIARKQAEKKQRMLIRLDPEVRRRRLAGFLERRGFSSDTIRAILRTVQ